MKFKFNPSPVKPEPPNPESHVSSEPSNNGHNPSAVVTDFVLKCCDCLRKAEIMAKGTSLCVSCYEERSRMGKL